MGKSPLQIIKSDGICDQIVMGVTFLMLTAGFRPRPCCFLWVCPHRASNSANEGFQPHRSGEDTVRGGRSWVWPVIGAQQMLATILFREKKARHTAGLWFFKSKRKSGICMCLGKMSGRRHTTLLIMFLLWETAGGEAWMEEHLLVI